METDTPGSFLMQLTLAHAMITAGHARCALIVQACLTSPHVDPTSPISPLFGDGATALVIGPVAPGRGVLGAVQFTDSRFPKTLVMSVPGGNWFDEGRPRFHVGDAAQMQQVFLGTADVCKQSIDEALRRASIAPEAVDFLCMHQGAPWLRDVLREHAGLVNARTVETFSKTAHLLSAILPSGLAEATRQGLLKDDDIVVMVAGGPGQTFGAAVVRWGR
jgi:3-oxoacyl-[acyl-carrier-protein] synthase-3